MSAKVLPFPTQEPILMPVFHAFEVSDDNESPMQTFTFTDQRGNRLQIAFGEPENGPTLDAWDSNGRYLLHMCLTVLSKEQTE